MDWPKGTYTGNQLQGLSMFFSTKCWFVWKPPHHCLEKIKKTPISGYINLWTHPSIILWVLYPTLSPWFPHGFPIKWCFFIPHRISRETLWPNSVGYKNYSQAWGYRMRLLSFIFSQNGLSYKMPTLKNGRAWILSYSVPTSWSSSCFLTKCHCDFYDGLTWLKWFLCKMRFTSLSYKILDLDFMSRLAWLKRKPWWFRGGATHPQGDPPVVVLIQMVTVEETCNASTRK